jgi:hypothetical protein
MPYSVTEQRTRVAVTSHFSREAGVRAVAHLVAAGTSFDALFCFNDLLALGAMEELRHRWISSAESRTESRTAFLTISLLMEATSLLFLDQFRYQMW